MAIRLLNRHSFAFTLLAIISSVNIYAGASENHRNTENSNRVATVNGKKCFKHVNFTSVPGTATVLRYVKETASGNGSGNSWANASNNLQAMINQSSAGDEVWVAKGRHRPAVNSSFSMKEGVKVYGGFPNNNDAASMAERNWAMLDGSYKLQNNSPAICRQFH